MREPLNRIFFSNEVPSRKSAEFGRGWKAYNRRELQMLSAVSRT